MNYCLKLRIMCEELVWVLVRRKSSTAAVITAKLGTTCSSIPRLGTDLCIFPFISANVVQLHLSRRRSRCHQGWVHHPCSWRHHHYSWDTHTPLCCYRQDWRSLQSRISTGLVSFQTLMVCSSSRWTRASLVDLQKVATMENNLQKSIMYYVLQLP